MNGKRKSLWLVTLLLLLCLSLKASDVYAASPRLIDEVGLLSSREAQEIRSRLDQVSEAHQFDVVIAVVQRLGYQPAHLYAADFFETRGFGYGEGKDGAILLLAMAERDLGFAALGSGIYAFTSAGQEFLDKWFLPDLERDRFYEGLLAFTAAVDDFLIMAEAGTPYDVGNIPLLPSERRGYQRIAFISSLVVALLIALITAEVTRSKLKSVRQQQYAQDYIREGSMKLKHSRDLFLYRNLRRVKIEEKKSGGQSFTTSSGRKATGHSKKF